MKPFKYNHITPQTRLSVGLSPDVRSQLNPFNDDDAEFVCLEDRIKLATESGADIGARVNPQYDADDTNDIDIMCSLRHDAMDIAEAFGKMPEQVAPPAKNESKINE